MAILRRTEGGSRDIGRRLRITRLRHTGLIATGTAIIFAITIVTGAGITNVKSITNADGATAKDSGGNGRDGAGQQAQPAVRQCFGPKYLMVN